MSEPLLHHFCMQVRGLSRHPDFGAYARRFRELGVDGHMLFEVTDKVRWGPGARGRGSGWCWGLHCGKTPVCL
jgi:hypothetical protein